MANEGWIKLNRQIQEHWLWKDEPFTYGTAWIDLLLLANYEDKKMPYKGEIILCKRGDVNLSYSVLADRWKWSRWKVKNFIGLLVNDGMVTTNATTHRTTITIVNYDKFQLSPSTDCTTDQPTNRQQTIQQADTTKKEKNKRNNKNVFTPPTLEEVTAYCQERHNEVNPKQFFDYFEAGHWVDSQGKPVRNWKQKMITWEKKQYKPKNTEKPKGFQMMEKTDYDFEELEKLF